MPIIKDTFGQSRVIEPKGAVPVTAWKVDNSREISTNECRIDLIYVHLERDNLQQICSECGYNEEKIENKILEIVGRRGKLHNPFTNSGGQVFGRIEEMGTEFEKGTNYKVGDEVLMMVSMTAHPLHINKIEKIDYDYGQIVVSGYAIIFSGSPFASIPNDINPSYLLVAHDEAGSLFSVSQMAKKHKRFLIIGKDILSCYMYVSAIKKTVNNNAYIAVIMDEDGINNIPPDSVIQEFNQTVNATYVLDVTKPVDEVKKNFYNEDYFDSTVNCEDLTGAGVIAVLLTREGGEIHNTTINNSNTQSILLAESMKKELTTQELGHYYHNYDKFIVELLRENEKKLDRLDSLFEEQEKKYKMVDKKASEIHKGAAQKAGDFIFNSNVTESLVTETLNVAKYDCNVIIQGETGVGKEKILELIHKNSTRKGKPCVKINCATIQENLAESEFFGYEPGAFTGAQTTGKVGYFEKANGGILFLDEVGTLSMSLQSKLLRVLQENQFFKVGGNEPIDVDVRVICANNISLRQLVEEGKFREDLYYRLNICTLTVPSLKKRIDDIPALAEEFLKKYCKRYGEDKTFSPKAITKLMEHDWPGNVRELENLVHKLFINSHEHVISEDEIDTIINDSLYDDLIVNLQRKIRSDKGVLDFNKIVEQQERQLIEYALKKNGSTRKAAEFLNMTQPQLMRKKKKYEI